MRTFEQTLLDALPAAKAFDEGKEIYNTDEEGKSIEHFNNTTGLRPHFHRRDLFWHIVEPPKTRPMNAEEWFERRYCIVKRKSDGVRFHVEMTSTESVLLHRMASVGGWKTFADMAINFTFDDGTPCEVTE